MLPSVAAGVTVRYGNLLTSRNMSQMVSKKQHEQKAVELLVEALRTEQSTDTEILEGGGDFPDFVLKVRSTGEEIWVEIVEAVESGDTRAIENQLVRQYYRNKGSGSDNFGVIIPKGLRRISPEGWISKAISHKGANRYGPAERARTLLLVDCSNEILVSREDALEIRQVLAGRTMGFKGIWCVSVNWQAPKAVLLASAS